MELALFALGVATALMAYPCAVWCVQRVRGRLRAWRERRAWARHQKRQARSSELAQAALEREWAEEQRQQASGWSFERHTWRL